VNACLLACVLLTPDGTQSKQPPPLTEEQQRKLQTLVAETQRKSAQLKKDLDGKQQALADKYADFQLDDKAVQKLQTEVLDLQKQLLDNYHRLHVELRTIVGPERFAVLRKRLDNILGVPPAKDKKSP